MTISGQIAQVLLTSATVNVYEDGTTTPIAVTMYDAASGGSTLSNPLTSSATNGEIEFWLDEPRRVDLKVTKSGYTTRTVTVDVSDSGDEEASTDVARTFTAAQTFNAQTRVGPNLGLISDSTTLGDITLYGTDGLNGPAWTFQAQTSTEAANLVIIPGESVDQATLNSSQILLYGKTGADYNRLGISNVVGAIIIDSTYNGAGTARAITIEMGGSAGGGIASERAIHIKNDSSVFLPGWTRTRDSKNWCGGRTTISDHYDTGDSRLNIDTRTGTPASDASDTASVEFLRGGANKWAVGLNFAGDDVDALDFYDRTNTRNVVQFRRAISTAETGLYLAYDNGVAIVMDRVTVGAADSGGAGYKLLRVPN